MKKLLAFCLSVVTAVAAFAGGSFRNPVINADVPDISVCKVGDTYYMISTTMHLMPGGPIMKSKDMVNWETVGYVFDRIDDGDRYDLIDSQTVYGQGQWASSIRYHMGKFWVWFTANGAPGKGFVFSADKPEGPWTLVARPPHMHDASLFFDEDGRRYLFTGSGGCTVVELDENFQPKEGGLNVKVVDGQADPEERHALLEGSSVIKHNGKYYICMISMKWGAEGRYRREVCFRADNIAGPYEKKIILETPFESYGGVGQGCLVGDDQSDEGWWALIFQDRGGIGRVPCTLPVTWVEGWPMVGEYTGVVNTAVADSPGDNPTGNPRLDKRRYRTPSDLSRQYPAVSGIIGSDDFDLLPVDSTGGYHARNGLSLYWQWNHNPVDEAWSLTERPGHMRLKTARVVDNLQVAPNTLTQRMAAPLCSGAVKIDISHMADGDVCGLAAYNGDSGVLRVLRKGGKYVLQLAEEKAVFTQPRNIERVDVDVIAEVPLKVKKGKANYIYLKIDGDFSPGRDMAAFSYSLDGEAWHSIGRELPMRFDYTRHFMGTKFAIFNYATRRTGGYVDVDWFRFEQLPAPTVDDTAYLADPQPADFDGYDDDFYIYLCFGQSNTEGAAKPEKFDYYGTDNFYMYATLDNDYDGRRRGQWYPAVPPFCVKTGGMSGADYFGRTLARALPGKKIGVVNVAVGGCKIGLFDPEDNSYALDTEPDWLRSAASRYDDSKPYEHLVKCARDAQRHGKIKGILLHQGESNVGDSLWLPTVQKIYDALIRDLGLDPAETPLLAGELMRRDMNGSCWQHNQTIARLPEYVANAHVVSSEGCVGSPYDHVHFFPAGYRKLGYHYACTYLTECLGFDPADVPEEIVAPERPRGHVWDGKYVSDYYPPLRIPGERFTPLQVGDTLVITYVVTDRLKRPDARIALKTSVTTADIVDAEPIVPGDVPAGTYRHELKVTDAMLRQLQDTGLEIGQPGVIITSIDISK